MCIAVYKPADARIEDDRIRTMFENNSHGAGFAFLYDGKLHVYRGYNTAAKFLKQYKKLAEDKQALLHFRIATSGGINTGNCHPFRVTPDIALIHNGVLCSMPAGAKRSDTRTLAEDVLRPLANAGVDLFANNSVLDYLRDVAGISNKLILMHADGRVKISGEAAGTWKDGVWYSNTSYEPKPKYDYKTYSYTKYGTHGHGYFGQEDDEREKKSLGKVFPVWVPGLGEFVRTSEDLQAAIAMGLIDP